MAQAQAGIVGQVRNFRGIAKADINIHGITLVVGQNGAGKSSLLQAIGAALSASPVPFFRSEKPDSPLVAKKNAKVLLHNDADMGGVRIVGNDGSMQIAWPDLEVTQQGDAPAASKVAAGLITPLDMPDAARAQFFSQLLRTTPSSEELTKALCDPKQVGFVAPEGKPGEPDYYENDSASINAVVDRVENAGFDGAHKFFSETNAKNKGKWEQITGARYGNTKGDFKPDGWDVTLEKETAESLAERVALAKDAVTAATGRAAVDDAVLAEAELNAKKEPAAKVVLEGAKKAHETAKLAMEAAVAAVDRIVVPETIACPHCGAFSTFKVIDGKPVLEESELSPEDIQAIKKSREDAIESMNAENKRLAKARDELDAAQSSYAKFNGAQASLKQLKESSGGATDKQVLLDAQSALSHAEANLSAFKIKQQADALHTRILLFQKVLDVLAPNGLRKKKLLSALDDFNSLLNGLCAGAAFPSVQLNEELDVLFEQRPYFICSDSQKWRARVIVQIAVAIKEGAPAVIVDGADILDADARNGFFGLLRELSKPDTASGAPLAVLVAMTLNDIEKAPALGEIGWGSTSWIEGGGIAATK